MSEDTYEPPPENVVHLTEFLEKVWRRKECRHQRLEVDESNRKVTCKDCGREVDAFEALVIVADTAGEVQRTWEAMRKAHRDLAAYVPRLRAVRELESMWRGNRLPLCPHCKEGVTAEGLSQMGWVNRAYAEAVRKDKAERACSAPDTPTP